MWKKRLAGLLAVVLAAVSLVGCQNASGDSAKEKVRLMVWSPSEDQSKDSGDGCRPIVRLLPRNIQSGILLLSMG